MKTQKVKRLKTKNIKIDSINQFVDLYLPSIKLSKKELTKENEDNYGNLIAMTILDGIKRDLTTTK
jgi:Na+/phosphate symporter